MEKIFDRELNFNIGSRHGKVNVYYALELKFFMYKLLFSHSRNAGHREQELNI